MEKLVSESNNMGNGDRNDNLNFKPISHANKRLILEAQKGDAAAINKVIELHYKDILYFAKKKVGPRDGEDVAQQAVIRIGNKIDTLRDPNKFKSWMMSTVFNECNEYLRSKKRRTNVITEVEIGDEAMLVSVDQNVDNILIDEDMKKQLTELIEDLPENYADAIRLRYYEELGYDEIAEVLSIDNKKVKNDLNRALRLLQSRITRKGGESKLFALGPAALVPAISQSLQADQAQLVTPEMVAHGIVRAQEHFGAQQGAGAAAGIVEKQSLSAAKLVVGGVAAVAVVAAGAVFAFSQAPAKEPEPEPITVEVAQEPEENVDIIIETVADMIGDEEAAILAGFEAQGAEKEAWGNFLDRIGATQEGRATEADYVYSFYLIRKQDKQLLLADKQSVSGGALEVRTEFGPIGEFPRIMRVINMFDTGDGNA